MAQAPRPFHVTHLTTSAIPAIFVGLLFAGCASTTPNSPPAPAEAAAGAPSSNPTSNPPSAPAQKVPASGATTDTKKMLMEMMGRETPNLTSAMVSASGPKSFSAKADVAGKPEIKPNTPNKQDATPPDHDHEVVLPIGSQQPITCLIYSSRTPAANHARNLFEATKSKVKSIEIEFFDTGAFGSRPYLQTNSVYLIEKDGVPLMGYHKIILVPHDGGLVLCEHDELGYKSTFVKAVKSFVTSIAFARPANVYSDALSGKKPIRHEIHTVKINGNKVGFSEIFEYKLKNSKSYYLTHTNLFAIRSASDIMANDSRTDEIEQPNGNLEISSYQTVSNNQVDRELTLNQAGKNAYNVEGTLQGKKVGFKLQSKSGALRGSSAINAAAARHFFKDKASGQLNAEKYIPDLDPSQILAVSLIKRSDEGVNKVITESISNGRLAGESLVEPSSSARRTEVRVGNINILQERVYTNAAQQ